MRLLKLVLHLNKRLSLGKITTFTITPEAPVQFIVGTNGSGKTTIIKEISPFPPDKDDFEDEGYKEAHFELTNSIYIVKSLKSGSDMHHSFMKDGVELNESGGVKTQLELCKKYFRYTPEIHDLLTSVSADSGFTSMSTGDRKKWFTLLADSNFDYAISVFKRVVEKYNESRFALRKTKENLVVESAKVLPEEEIAQIKTQTQELYKEVERLIEMRQPALEPAETMVSTVNEAYARLRELAQSAKANILKLESDLPLTVNETESAIAVCQHKANEFLTASNALYEEHTNINKLAQTVKASSLESAAVIHTRINDNRKAANEIDTKSVLDIEFNENAEVIVASCNQLLQSWPEVSELICDMTNVAYSRKEYQELSNHLEAVGKELNQTKVDLARQEQTVEHQEKHREQSSVSCPKCSHAFHPNFSDLLLKQAKNNIPLLNVKIARLEAETEAISEKLSKMSAYFTALDRLLNQLSTSPGMNPFIQYLSRTNTLRVSPASYTSLLSQVKTHANNMSLRSKLLSQIEEDKRLYERVIQIEESGMADSVESRLEAVVKKIGDLEQDKADNQRLLTRLQQHKRRQQDCAAIEQRLKMGQEFIDKKVYAIADSIRREVFAEYLRSLQTELANKERALQQASNQVSVLEHLKKSIETLTVETDDYKLLVKELSPTEGLIAQGIFGFMQVMIGHMNKNLKMLFSFPLEVLPCSSEGTSLSLSYKFPLVVDGAVRKDVSMGSSGMREVINYAFVIAVMKAMHIEDYPLFLDEFGSKLDLVHKQSATMMLRNIVELERFEQVFMISHDVSQYNSFGLSEICLLHSANVQLPKGCTYNKHVTMT